MSNTTSAKIFGDIFNHLLKVYQKNPKSPESEFIWEFTGDLYNMTKQYDFALYEMDCEKALDVFELADLDLDDDDAEVEIKDISTIGFIQKVI